jgi:ATP-dependent DNA helicase RecG
MLRSELLELIANGESSGVEFKRDDIRPEQLGKEIVALANFHGGIILLGVEDDGTISGIQRENLQEWIMDTVFATKVHPMILPFYEEIVMPDDKRIAVITFPQGTTKPYVLRHNHREDIYIRVGSVSRLATREQQARLFATGGILHPETLPVAGTSFASLDHERLKDYLKNVISDPEVPESDGDWIRRLVGMGFMTTVSDTHTVCTIAGLLLFGLTPRKFIRQAGIRLMVFEGMTKEYKSLTDEVIDGPLVGRWAIDEEGSRILVDSGVIDTFSEMIRPFVATDEGEVGEDMRRSKQWIYPWEAIRESLINAIAHRDWTRFVDIETAVYSDRLEVISPGALQNSMTVQKMIAGQRSPRNPIIVEVLKDYGYVDTRGMGVRTKIIPLMRHYNQTEPIFEATDDYLKTTLPQKEGAGNPS